jgi:hypothetical protein
MVDPAAVTFREARASENEPGAPVPVTTGHAAPYFTVLVREVQTAQRSEHTKFKAVMVVLPVYRTGAANLRFPIGGIAKGMPRYSETFVALGAA